MQSYYSHGHDTPEVVESCGGYVRQKRYFLTAANVLGFEMGEEAFCFDTYHYEGGETSYPLRPIAYVVNRALRRVRWPKSRHGPLCSLFHLSHNDTYQHKNAPSPISRMSLDATNSSGVEEFSTTEYQHFCRS